MMCDLLKGFVPFDWVKELDFTTLEKLNNSYITDDLRERADDVIWRVRFKDQWLYVYLLLEFQSTVDRFMAVRLLSYVGLLYQDLIKAKQLPQDKKLPPVLPIVLYNGRKPWKAAVRLVDLLTPMPEQLQAFQPALQYVLIDESSYDTAELENVQNLVAALIRMEWAKSEDSLVKAVANLLVWLDREKQADLRRGFKEWLGQMLSRNGFPGIDPGAIHDLTEMHDMLNERFKEWERSYREEGLRLGLEEGLEKGLEKGREEGLEKGIEQGIGQGEARLLRRLLTKRFGQVPAWAEQRIDAATTDQLEHWSEQILDADSIEAVFGG
jgi:predicted transposase/invertase (TIGR01784 family)